jgi:acyl-CoA reductase-like NAD-dependent aldehyde dehydrogenase
MTETTRWHERAAALQFDVRAVIGGRRVALPGPAVDSVNPATGRVVAGMPAAATVDVDLAVRAARVAFEAGEWSRAHPRARGRTLFRWADLLTAHAEEFGLLDSLEMGMPIENAVADVAVAADSLRWCAEAADKLPGAVLPSAQDTLGLAIAVPRGVVAAITPWNFPSYNAVSKLGPALAVGNSVVLKPSEVASLSALRIADLAAEAGLPDGVLSVVPGTGASAGEALARHGDVDSTRVGRRLMELSAASNLKPLALELGGKSPQVVLPGVADLAVVAAAVSGSVFYNSGQVCTAGSRLIVHTDVRDELLARLVALIEEMSVGDPLAPATTHGPLATRSQLDGVETAVRAAREGGATIVTGGRRTAALPAGFGYEPTVVVADPAADVVRRELFGPVLAVLEFRTPQEAVALANDTDYGLAASVWAGDAIEGLAVARRIRAGYVTVNPGAGEPPSGASMEPARTSGFGVEGGLDGMRAYTRTVSITVGLDTGAAGSAA